MAKQQHGVGRKDAPGAGKKSSQQIARLQVAAGPTRVHSAQIQLLNDRIQALRTDMASRTPKAWEKPNWRGIPSAPYLLDYIERIFTDWSEITVIAAMRTDPPSSAVMARSMARG